MPVDIVYGLLGPPGHLGAERFLGHAYVGHGFRPQIVWAGEAVVALRVTGELQAIARASRRPKS